MEWEIAQGFDRVKLKNVSISTSLCKEEEKVLSLYITKFIHYKFIHY